MPFLIAGVVLLAVEVAAAVEVAHLIGTLPTVLLLIATGVFGPPLVRRAGFSVWVRARQRVDRGEMPGREVVDGLLLLVAGVLICIPGFITDVVGVLLLLPPGRAVARALARRSLGRRVGLVASRPASVGGPVGGGPERGWPGAPIDAATRDAPPSETDGPGAKELPWPG